MLAYTYPLLSIFWTMLEFFIFFLWIWLLIVIFSDIFRSHDIGGLAKALWVLFVIILPYLGVLVYLIARGGSMHERAAAQVAQQQHPHDSGRQWPKGEWEIDDHAKHRARSARKQIQRDWVNARPSARRHGRGAE